MNSKNDGTCNRKDINAKRCEIYSEVFSSTNQMVVILKNDLTVDYANNAMLDYLGLDLEEIFGKEYWSLPIWEHSVELQNKIIFAMEKVYRGETVRFQTTHINKYHKLRDIDFEIKAKLEDDGKVKYLIAMGYDITEIKETKSALRRRDIELETFFKYSVDGYFILSLDEYIFVDTHDLEDVFRYVFENQKMSNINSSVLEVFEISNSEITPQSLLIRIFKTQEELFVAWRNVIMQGTYNDQVGIIIGSKLKHIDLSLIPYFDDEGRYMGLFGIVKDVTKTVDMIEKMTYLATKDPMTGINNRRSYLEESTKIAFNTSKDNQTMIIMMDIDNFKRVNDSYGHDVGDEVIKMVSNHLVEKIGSNGVGGRMGGEEFSGCIESTVNNPIALIEDIRETIENTPNNHVGQEFFVTVSIGATYIVPDEELEFALKRADNALYEAKRTGKNKVVIH